MPAKNVCQCVSASMRVSEANTHTKREQTEKFWRTCVVVYAAEDVSRHEICNL